MIRRIILGLLLLARTLLIWPMVTNMIKCFKSDFAVTDAFNFWKIMIFGFLLTFISFKLAKDKEWG